MDRVLTLIYIYGFIELTGAAPLGSQTGSSESPSQTGIYISNPMSLTFTYKDQIHNTQDILKASFIYVYGCMVLDGGSRRQKTNPGTSRGIWYDYIIYREKYT